MRGVVRATGRRERRMTVVGYILTGLCFCC